MLTHLRFVHQYDEDYDSVKKTRRPGRAAGAREDLLKMKIEALEKEYQHGFCTLDTIRLQLLRFWLLTEPQVLPDLSKQENIDLLNRWEGAWAFLASLSWIRLSKTGNVRPSNFPPSAQ